MSDLKLFKLQHGAVRELESRTSSVEKALQNQIESNMDAFLGVTFLASEYSTGREHGGRMDSIGIDENGCPAIIEYKRASNDNIINQGLFYLDWLMDHKDAFELLVIRKLGQKHAEKIEWPNPRLICIASDFSKYDEHAVKQMNRNIELVRYRIYEDGLLLLELVNSTSAPKAVASSGSIVYKTVGEFLAQSDVELQTLFESVRTICQDLGDDVQEKELKYYFAFRRLKNFACVEVHPQKRKLLVFVKVDPDSVELENGFSRDVRKIGHFGTGDLELTIKSQADLEKAVSFIAKSYEIS
jgi:predicted transport protein